MIRAGIGYDAHKLEKNRPLILGGIVIPSKKGSLGHSDGDVLLHSIVDAMLGSLALGDIGKYFPSTEKRWKNKSSLFFLNRVNKLITKNGYQINNIDSTIILQEPHISNFINDIILNIANELKLSKNFISVKASTKDKLGFHKNVQGIEAMAIVTISNL